MVPQPSLAVEKDEYFKLSAEITFSVSKELKKIARSFLSQVNTTTGFQYSLLFD